MRKISRILFIATLSFILAACTSDEKEKVTFSEQKMNEFEQDIEKEIRARKIDVMQMKQDIKQLDDTLKTEFMDNIETIETDFIKAESDFKKLKSMENSAWADFKPYVDSTFRYLGAQIDTTKLDIIIATDTTDKEM